MVFNIYKGGALGDSLGNTILPSGLTYEEEIKKKKMAAAATATQQQKQKKSIVSASHKEIVDFSSQTKLRSKAEKEVTNSALASYFRLRNTVGQGALDKRLSDCLSIWRRYYKPYDGANSVWAMVTSPYSIEELEKMGKYGQSVVFNYNASNKQNYMTPDAADGTKDASTIGAVLGLGALGKNTYQPYTGQGVSATGLTATREAARDEWQGEWLSNNKLPSVIDLQTTTGIKLSAYKTYAEFKKATDAWKDKQRDPLVIEKYDQANRKATLEYQEWAQKNHGKELAAFTWAGAGQVVEGVGISMMLASPLSLIGGGVEGLTSIGARWAARSLAGKLAAAGSTGLIAANLTAMAYSTEEKAVEAAQEKRDIYETKVKTLAQKRADDVLAMMSGLDEAGDRESIKKIQEELQSPLLDEDGVVVRVPLGQGLIADGLLTDEWKAVISQASDAEMRATADLQQMLIMGGYAPKDLEITGSFEKWDDKTQEYVDDGEWQEALEQAQSDWASQQKLAESHPAIYTFLKTSGLPMSWEGLKAIGTKLTNEGYLYAPLKALAQSGYYVGGVVNAIPAVLEFKVKMDKNPERRALQKRLVEVVSANLPDDTSSIPFDVDSSSMSAGKAQYLVENGDVTDSDAQDIVNKLNANEAMLLSEGSARWVGLFGYSTKDYNSFHSWVEDNYDQWHAINMTIDIVGQMAVGRTLRLTGRGVGRTAESLASGVKFKTILSRVIKMSNEGDFGNVHAYVGGSGAKEFVNRVAGYRYGKDIYTRDASVVKEKAGEIADAARAGDKTAMLAAMGEYGKTTEGVAFAGLALKKAKSQKAPEYVEYPVAPLVEAKLSRAKQVAEKPWVEAKAPTYKQKPVSASIEDVIASRLVGRQSGKGDIWGTRDVTDFTKQTLLDMWSGADGTYYDVLPRLMGHGVKGKSYTRISMERAVAGIENKSVQKVASALFLPFYRGPIASYSYKLTDFPHRVADYVGAITNDISLVNRWRTKAALTDFSKPRAAQRFEAGLQALKGEYLNTVKGKQTVARAFSQDLVKGDLLGATDQLTGLKMSGGEKEAAEFVRPKVGDKEAEVVMLTSQQKTEIRMGRTDIMLADVKVRDGSPALTWAINKTRKVERGFAAASTPMRIVSVGAGGIVLFQKHAFADTGRSLVSEGVGALRLGHNRKVFKDTVDRIAPAIADRVLFERKVAVETEQHYQLEGGIEATRQARKAFNDKGRPKNMSAAIDTIRRIIMDEGYRAFSEGGEAGLRTWLDSPAGESALKNSGAIRATKAALKAGGEKPADKTVVEVAKSDYLAQKLELFADYAQLPRLSKRMVEMAAGKAPRHDSDIKSAILEAYEKGRENPTVDVPIETGNNFINLFARMTKAAMTPNRLNREAVFDKVFNEVVADLTKKQGVSVDDAAVIASTVARTRTSQVHFDLSEGMRFEMKHRWFAWFGTKHRLWNTWLATAAIKHPGYAAALNEYAKWMEDRNADESIPEWEKHNIVFTIGGKRFSINLAPYAWAMDYAIESPFGNLVENGLLTSINKVAGTDLKPAPDAFGFSLSRFDPMMKSIWRLIHAPSGDDKTEWLKFIDDLPEDEREKFSEQVTTVWALSGGKKSIADCEKEVLMGNVKHEALRFLKPASSKMYSEDQVDLFNAKVEYEKVAGTPQASDFLLKNPEFAMTIGAGYRDPYAQQELNAALSVYANIKDKYQASVVSAARNGKLVDTNYASNLYDQEQREIDDLKDTCPAFANWMKGSQEDKTFGQIAHYAFPSITEKEWEKAEIPDESEVNIYSEELENNFEEQCRAYGVSPTSTSAVVKMLRRNLIEIPLAEYKKQLPSDLSAAVKENARLLATGDHLGLYRATIYVETMTNLKKRDMWLAGTKYNKADGNNLLMMMLTPAEKEYLGWKTDEQATQMWLQYGVRLAQIDSYCGAINKGPSSKVYKDMKAQLTQEIEETWLPQSKIFAMEWDFSHMRLSERMAALGYGTADDVASRGWADCLDIIEEYWGELDNAYNKSAKQLGVGPQAQAAADIARTHLKKLVALSKENPDWYDEWKYLKLGPGKFGFYSKWKLADGSDWDLWARDEPVDESEFADVYGE